MSNRDELLLRMYDQLFNDINRHITVVWQAIGAVVGAFTVFALVEKKIISIDLASSIIVLLVLWLIAHLYDAAYWYNRNLTMIANIERQFLQTSDLRDIHYYFGKHRPDNVMLTHLQIQYALGLGLGALVLLYHFFDRVFPGFGAPIHNFDPVRGLPYILVIAATIYLYRLRNKRNKSYREFLENSPGIDVDTEGINYGVGHGFKTNKKDSQREQCTRSLRSG